MRICLNAALLAPRAANYRAAGISHYLSQSLLALGRAAPAGWQLEAQVSPELAADEYPGLQLQSAPWSLRRPLARILWEQTLLPRRAHKADLLHAMAFAAPARLRVPLVLTIYDLSFLQEPQRLPAARRHYLRLASRHSARRARRILTISAAVAEDIARIYGIERERIDIAPPGIERAQFRPLPANEVAAFRREKGLPARYWLYLGTLEPRKNLPTLLAAYAELPAAERPTLVLAGGAGWHRRQIQAAIERYQLADSLLLPGFLPANELPFWYNGAELFLFPSLHEGFGMPVLEAMACGIPVITSDASALRELAADSGRVIPARDVSAWSAALRAAGQDSEWRRAAVQRSLKRAAAYSWAQTAARTLACYRTALA